MQIDFNEQGGCRRELKVSFSAEEVGAKYAEISADYVKYGRVNGFRPGHAPAAMIRRQYAKQIDKDVHDRLFGEGYRGALAKHEFVHVADIDFHEDKIADGQPYSFTLVMEVAPTIDASAYSYKGLPLDAKKIDIADAAVTEAIDRFLKNSATYQDAAPGEAVAADDIVSLDFDATLDGHPLAEGLAEDAAKGLASGKSFFVRASDGPSPIPGIGPKLVGLAIDAPATVEVTFPDDFRVEALRGKTASYAVTVRKIRRAVPRTMDEAFFKEMGVADEAAFRARVRESLENEATDEEARRLETSMEDALLAKVDFDLPEAEVERVKNRIVYRIVDENVRRGIPEEVLRGKLDEINASATEGAKRSLRLEYLYRAIAKAEKLSVSNHEIRSLLASRGPDTNATLKRMAKEAKTTEDAVMEDIRSTMLHSKVGGFLLKNASWSGDGAEALRKHMGAEPDEPAGKKA